MQAAIRRPDILKENPGIAFGAVGKLMGEEWRAMPEDIKAPYVAKAEAVKAQYDKDKAAYGESPCPRSLSYDCFSTSATSPDLTVTRLQRPRSGSKRRREKKSC